MSRLRTNRIIAACVLVAVLLAFALPALAGQPPMALPEGVKALRNLEYATASGRPLLLDLYLPENAPGKLPVVVWIHGGAWIGGSKDGCPAVPMTARGYAVASISYRFSNVAPFPAQIHDCKAAIRWLRANAKQHNLDPDHIGVWGASAGGHLVAMLGTSGGVKELEGDEGNLDQPSRVQAVCDWFGPTDLLQMAATTADRKAFPPSGSPDSPESKLVGGPLLENKDKAAKASPLTYVNKDCPPFLIMHGDKDALVPLSQSELLCEALKKAGADATLHVVKGAGHGFGGPEINKMVNDFFDKHLKPAK
jgi:acetyl esterase/lipase